MDPVLDKIQHIKNVLGETGDLKMNGTVNYVTKSMLTLSVMEV